MTEIKGRAHAEGFGEHAAQERPEHAASRGGALHEAQTEAELHSRHAHRQNREAGGPKPRGEALKNAILSAYDEALEKEQS